MQIDVWSDVVCPWCYIGKRRLETAIGWFEHTGAVEVRWHSFQLDPTRPKGDREPVQDMLARKYRAAPEQVRAMNQQVSELAAAEGLTYALEAATSVNTLDAHRLNHFADRHGLGGAMHERLLRAHLVEAAVLDDPDTLVRLGTEVGLPHDEVHKVVHGEDYADEVAADIREAHGLGITGVPFFVLDQTYGVSGAQPAETFLTALRTAQGTAAAAGRREPL